MSNRFIASWILLPAISALAAGCGTAVSGSGSTTGEGGAPAGSTTGAGGALTTASSTGGAGGGTGGAGGATGCQSDADCLGDPGGPVCDLDSGECVGCLVEDDNCIQGQYCEPSTLQ